MGVLSMIQDVNCMDKNPSEELRALEVELAKILCEVDLEKFASESLINRENEFMIDKSRRLDKLIENRVISNAIQKGFDQLRSAPAQKQTQLPSERIRELSRDPGVYTVDAIIKYLDQEFLERKGR